MTDKLQDLRTEVLAGRVWAYALTATIPSISTEI
jgi:hypothetical protein